jgi:hypothetical protein
MVLFSRKTHENDLDPDLQLRPLKFLFYFEDPGIAESIDYLYPNRLTHFDRNEQIECMKKWREIVGAKLDRLSPLNSAIRPIINYLVTKSFTSLPITS